jgi:hypothetical protein
MELDPGASFIAGADHPVAVTFNRAAPEDTGDFRDVNQGTLEAFMQRNQGLGHWPILTTEVMN